MTQIISNWENPHMIPSFKYTEVTERIIGVFYEVYNELGHGFLESVYQTEFPRLAFDNSRIGAASNSLH
jgi:hypothetical protein